MVSGRVVNKNRIFKASILLDNLRRSCVRKKCIKRLTRFPKAMLGFKFSTDLIAKVVTSDIRDVKLKSCYRRVTKLCCFLKAFETHSITKLIKLLGNFLCFFTNLSLQSRYVVLSPLYIPCL